VPGAAKVDDRVFRELRRKIGKLADASVSVGVLKADEPHADSDMTIVEIAAVHEFGSPAAGIPERSFIRSTFENSDVVNQQRALCAKVARKIIRDKMTPEEGLQILGQWGVAQVKKRIRAHIPPPLKDETIKRKKSSTPLIDTGQLLNALTYEVKGGK
jgi:hypothetical protein